MYSRLAVWVLVLTVLCSLPVFADEQPLVRVYGVEESESEAPSGETTGDSLQLEVRIKDITRVEGVNTQQLAGIGLVVGLAGTGDSRRSEATAQMLKNALGNFGLAVADMPIKNTAAVFLTAVLPPFSRPGDRIDITVSSMADAKSLRGGTLLASPLFGDDEEIYALAQGPIFIGGYTAGNQNSSVSKNHSTVGMIPGGGILQKAGLNPNIGQDGRLNLVINSENADFATASRLAEVLNRSYAPGTAAAVDAANVEITIPPAFRERVVDFIAELGQLSVSPDQVARVVIDEKTGMVIVGQNVRIAPAAVAHGSLRVEIRNELEVVQPPPLSEGETVTVPDTSVLAAEEKSMMTTLQPGGTLADVVAALNGLGAGPQDIIAILQALKAAGALFGELEIR